MVKTPKQENPDDKSMPDQANAIRFVQGSFMGKKGWLRKKPQRPGGYVEVTVMEPRGIPGTTYDTSVDEGSFRMESEYRDVNCTYAKAAMCHHPDVESSLITACRKLAKCDVTQDPDGFSNLMVDELGKAAEWQNRKGNKAAYRRVPWRGYPEPLKKDPAKK